MEELAQILIRMFEMPLVILGIYILIKLIGKLIYQKRRQNCNIPVEATVIRLIESHDSDGSTYAPEFEFNYQGQIRTLHPNVYSSPTPYRVGDTFTLMIDANAEKFVLSEESKEKLKELKRSRNRVARIVLIILVAFFWIGFNIGNINALIDLIKGAQ